MSIEAKAVVRRLYEEVWNKRRLELVNELISPSHALHDPHLSGSAVGPDAYKRICTQYIAAFPDLRFTAEDYISEKDKVVVSWTISGTHKREFRG
ncbi:MAG: ester cyclase, partial [Candidatus Acidiferrum sp.]